MFDNKETEKKLVETCQRVIRAMVLNDKENRDLVMKDLEVIKTELIPQALKSGDEELIKTAKALQKNISILGENNASR